MSEHESCSETNMTFSVTCGVGGDRGIYLRESRNVDKPMESSVTVEPQSIDSKTGVYTDFVHVYLNVGGNNTGR